MKKGNDLKKKINSKKAVISVIGLGYVGLPIALEFLSKGFQVKGYDTSKRRVNRLEKGVSYINDIQSRDIKKAVNKCGFLVSTDADILAGSDIFIICVPTPLRKVKEPNISYVVRSTNTLRKYLAKGQLIILESTTYPGTTKELIIPILEKNGSICGEDFYLAFSPERIDPGNKAYPFSSIPKVMGGMSKEATKLGSLLYSKIVKKVVPVSSPEVAETTKLLENTFRIVNIGLINEFATLCHKLGIDVWEVINAADTKPFGFMPFYPGPGIGGHCIPADPMYLSWKARKVGFETKMIDLASKVNRKMPRHVVERIAEILKLGKKKIAGSKVLICGVTYKKDVNDLRESPALEILSMLEKKKARISFFDPLIPKLEVREIKKKKSVKLSPKLIKSQDIVAIITDHTDVNYKQIARNAKSILDTRDILRRNGIEGNNIVRL